MDDSYEYNSSIPHPSTPPCGLRKRSPPNSPASPGGLISSPEFSTNGIVSQESHRENSVTSSPASPVGRKRISGFAHALILAFVALLCTQFMIGKHVASFYQRATESWNGGMEESNDPSAQQQSITVEKSIPAPRVLMMDTNDLVSNIEERFQRLLASSEFRAHDNGFESRRRVPFMTEEEHMMDWWDETENCKYYDWQRTAHPSCNNMHEFFSTPDQLSYVANGGESVIFGLTNTISTYSNSVESFDSQRVVLKAGRWDKTSFSSSNYHHRQIDATIMEHLSSSPYVMDMFGFCGMSVISPRAGTDLYGVINSVRNGGKEPAPLDKLMIIIQLAEGVAAMHEAGVAHNDLDTSQHIFYDGMMHLNDFTYGFLMRHNPKTLVPCKATDSDFTVDLWKYKAPEYLAWGYQDKAAKPIRMDAAEVYSLGAEIYHFLTMQLMWEGEPDRRKCKRLLFEGKRPPLPDSIARSKDEAIQAIVNALNACWRHRPEDRPSAKQIAMFLRKDLSRIRNATGEAAREIPLAVELPPLVKARPNEEICYYKYMTLPGRGDRGPGCD